MGLGSLLIAVGNKEQIANSKERSPESLELHGVAGEATVSIFKSGY